MWTVGEVSDCSGRPWECHQRHRKATKTSKVAYSTQIQRPCLEECVECVCESIRVCPWCAMGVPMMCHERARVRHGEREGVPMGVPWACIIQ